MVKQTNDSFERPHLLSFLPRSYPWLVCVTLCDVCIFLDPTRFFFPSSINLCQGQCGKDPLSASRCPKTLHCPSRPNHAPRRSSQNSLAVNSWCTMANRTWKSMSRNKWSIISWASLHPRGNRIDTSQRTRRND